MRLLSLLLSLLALGVGLAACGGGDDVDKDAYIDKVNGAQEEFRTEAGKLNLANPDSASDFKSSLDSLDGLLDKLIGDLEDTEAPDEVSDEHDRLVKSLRDYDAVLTKNKGGLDSGERSQVTTAAQAIATGSAEFSSTFDQTINSINRELRE